MKSGGLETHPYVLCDGAKALVFCVVQGYGIPALASMRPVRVRGRPTTLV
jgi:hypothetical protein